MITSGLCGIESRVLDRRRRGYSVSHRAQVNGCNHRTILSYTIKLFFCLEKSTRDIDFIEIINDFNLLKLFITDFNLLNLLVALLNHY